MKRNVFGAMIVAGGLALATSISGFADNTTGTAAKAAIGTCASNATAALTIPGTLTGDAASEAHALQAETAAGIAEVVSEANNSIDEVVAETNDEDSGPRDAAALSAELNAIVDESCKAIANVKAEFDKAIVELKAPEVAQPEVDKQDVEKQDVEKKDVEKPEKPEVQKPEKPDVHQTTREGND
jgi:hypothetical protein